MIFRILKPEQCNSKQIQTFYDLVIEGGQVLKNGLIDRIKAANLLSFCEIENEIVGVASIKKPGPNYKKRIFRKANVATLSENYNFEVGYAVTKQRHRCKGISQQIISSLIDNVNTDSFFATTKVDEMRHILEKIGFSKLGDNYKNDRNETLTLYQFTKIK